MGSSVEQAQVCFSAFKRLRKQRLVVMAFNMFSRLSMPLASWFTLPPRQLRETSDCSPSLRIGTCRSKKAATLSNQSGRGSYLGMGSVRVQTRLGEGRLSLAKSQGRSRIEGWYFRREPGRSRLRMIFYRGGKGKNK